MCPFSVSGSVYLCCSIIFRLVEFADKDGMRYALDKLDGEELDGKKIRLVEEKRGGGGGGGGARRQSRSRSPAPRRSRYASQLKLDYYWVA